MNFLRENSFCFFFVTRIQDEETQIFYVKDKLLLGIFTQKITGVNLRFS